MEFCLPPVGQLGILTFSFIHIVSLLNSKTRSTQLDNSRQKKKWRQITNFLQQTKQLVVKEPPSR